MTRQQEHIALRIRATQDSSPPESWSHSNICPPMRILQFYQGTVFATAHSITVFAGMCRKSSG
jgi:hypothetical protein